MAKKASVSRKTKSRAKAPHPGMMGDGTEEQNLGQRGNPGARIKKKDVVAAFGKAKAPHPGMMGDGTEEQNLGQRGNPAARIKKKDVVAAFGKKRPTKQSPSAAARVTHT